MLLLGGLLIAVVAHASDISMDIHRQWLLCQYKTLATQKAPCIGTLSQQSQA
ncbi:hypothetical protein [Dickeya sp. CFBP 2040]|uniref:hypothetical protein n=1 Tax=Dickeya sp. CFBP 2040 TaxID=2718531 RepID=UPI001445A21E|nr:hypothetical protein [Dickeya sp. CFBP 2040]